MQGEGKTVEKKKTNAVLILSVIVFIIGFGLGFYIFGYHKQNTKNYKDELREVIAYIGDLENKQKELMEKNQAIAVELDMLKKGATPQSAETASLQARVAALERENGVLRNSLGQNQALIQENYQLRARIQGLEGAGVPGTAPTAPVPPAAQPAPAQAPR